MLNWKKIRLRCAVGSGLWTLAFLTVTAVPAVPALAVTLGVLSRRARRLIRGEPRTKGARER